MSTSAALGITDTAIGKKLAMALSGLVLLGFLVVHMVGNLRVFVSSQSLNEYAAFLRATPSLLWTTRLLLLGAVGLHVWSAWQLWRANRKARPVPYARTHLIATTYAARTMVVTGPLVALYLLYHLAHLTLGFTRGLGYAHAPADVYANVVASFRLWPVALCYTLANLGLGVHLYHGAWSLLQTLGLRHPRYHELLRSLAVAFALAVVTGFVAVPLGVLGDHLGWLRLLP
jgi:succinate dehydrogenase / fumarate reductase cytochrome b subunit